MTVLTDKTKQLLQYSPTHLLSEDFQFGRIYMVVAMVIIRLILLYNGCFKIFTCLVVLSDVVALILESQLTRNTINAIIDALYLPIKDNIEKKKEEETTLKSTEEELLDEFVTKEAILFFIERIFAISYIIESLQFSFYTILSMCSFLIPIICLLYLAKFNIQALKRIFSEYIQFSTNMAITRLIMIILLEGIKTWICMLIVSDVVGFISIILQLEGTCKIIRPFIQALDPPIKESAEEESHNETKEEDESNQESSSTEEINESNDTEHEKIEEEEEEEDFEEHYKRRFDDNLSLLVLLNESQNNMSYKLDQLINQYKFNFEAEKEQLYEHLSTLSQTLQDTLYQWHQERNMCSSRLDDLTKQCAKNETMYEQHITKQKQLIEKLEDTLRQERLDGLEEQDSMLLFNQRSLIEKNEILEKLEAATNEDCKSEMTQLELALKLSDFYRSRLADCEDKIFKILKENEAMEGNILKLVKERKEKTALVDEKSKTLIDCEKKCQALEEENKSLYAKLSVANKSCQYLGAILRNVNSGRA